MMKNLRFSLIFIGVFGLILLILKLFPPPRSNQPAFRIVRMQITSSAFENNDIIPVKYTCDGETVSPPLTFTDIPKTAVSLSLVVEDPDAPNGTFTHLNLSGIPADKTGFDEGELSDFIPPCPPSGTHRYRFILRALNDKGAQISQSILTGLYSAQ